MAKLVESRFLFMSGCLLVIALGGCPQRDTSRPKPVVPPPSTTQAAASAPGTLDAPDARSASEARSNAGATFIFGILGKPLSSVPEGPILSVTRANGALLLEENDAGWIRVLDPEGNAGWLRDVDLKRGTGTLRSCSRPFRITTLPPTEQDHADFAVVDVEPEAQGRLIGASKQHYPFSLPYVSNRGRATAFVSDGHAFTAPLARVDFDGRKGWAGIDELCSSANESPTTIRDMQSLGISGLLHPFFVQSRTATLRSQIAGT